MSKVDGDMYIADGDFIKDIEVNDLRNRYTLTKGSTQKMVNIPWAPLTRSSLLCLQLSFHLTAILCESFRMLTLMDLALLLTMLSSADLERVIYR